MASRILLMSTLFCLIPIFVGADEIDSGHLKFFESQVRPLLAEKCVGCHGAEKQEGELRLDTPSAMLQGGESGAAISPERTRPELVDRSHTIRVTGDAAGSSTR